MDQMIVALSLLYLCTLWTTGMALQCYSCKSSKIASKSGAAAGILQSMGSKVEEDRACSEADITDMGSIPTASCAENQVCGDVRASITLKERVFRSSVTIETVGRGCIARERNVYGAHCSSSARVVKSATNVFLSILNDLPLVDVEVDGEMCYCETDLCTAGRCGDYSFKIADYCIRYWYVAVPAGILLILFICCCCCCCCGCCCKKTPRPVFLQAFPAVTQVSPVPYVRFDGNATQADVA